MAVAKPLHLRLFLEGIEVPVISAQISINTNAPATAAIQIIPLDEAQDFKPRTMVHLFFLDVTNQYENRSKTPSSGKPLSYKGIKGTYRLLYSGEAIGFTFVQTPQSRSFVLQCVDFSNYWDSAQATAISYGAYGNLFTNQAAVYGSDTQLFDDIVDFPAQKLVAWISQTPQTEGLKDVGGLAGGIISMLEAMGGVPGHVTGINDFFSVAELRCRLLQQIAAEENDNTAKQVLGGTVFMEWLRNGLQGIGEQVSFRDMMKLLFQHIFYDFVPNPAAKFEEVKKGATKMVGGGSYQLMQSPQALSALRHLGDATMVLGPSIDSDTSDATQISQATKASTAAAKAADKAMAALQSSTPSASTVVSKIRSGIQNALNSLSGRQAGATGKSLQQSVDLLNDVKAAINNPNNSKSVVQVAPHEVSFDTTQRLKTQIIRPNCWFSAPPKCNVIFPEQFTQISYDRNWLETSRVLVQEFDCLIGSDALINNYYLAPGFGMASADLNKEMKGEASYRVLLDHEIHTGILVKAQCLPNTSAVNTQNVQEKIIKSARSSWCHRAALFYFFDFRFGQRQASISGRFNPSLVCGFPGLIIRMPYNVDIDKVKRQIQRMQMYGDDSVTSAKVVSYLNEFSAELGAPSQLVGMVAGINHNVDQSGGTTSATMHHVRRHLGVDDDFLSLYLQTLTTSKRVVKTILSLDTLRSDKKNAVLLKLLVNLTPQGAATAPPPLKQPKAGTTATKQTTTTWDPDLQSYVQTTADGSLIAAQSTTKTSSPPPLCMVGSIDGVQGDPSGTTVYVPSRAGTVSVGGKGVYAAKGGTIKGIQVLPPYAPTPVKATGYSAATQAYPNVALYEEVPISVEGEVPIEEVIRPAWFSLAYRNDRIGKDIYDNFFGCGSIIDQLMVEGLGGEPLNMPASPGDPDIPSNDSDASPESVISALQTDQAQRNALSIEKAVNLLGYLYAQVKSKDLDVDDFIRTYTDRPIATIDDIFGEGEGSLLKFSKKGLVYTAYKDGGKPGDPVKIGFHSVAVNPDLASRGGLAGLVVDPTTGFQRYGAVGKSVPIPERYDVRPEKRSRVLNYLDVLKNKGQGLRG